MSNNIHKNRKLKLLVGASAVMLVAGPAFAGGVTVVDNSVNSALLNDLTKNTVGFETIYSYPLNQARVSATVTATGGITRTDTYQGSTLSSSNASTSNTLAALAIGNTFTNTVPSLSVLDSNISVDGLAVSGVAINDGFVTSLVENSTLDVSLENTPLDSSTNSNNSITATTMINKGVTTVAGQVPNTYTSVTGGSGAIDQFAASYTTGDAETGIITTYENLVNATGSVVLSTLQHAELNASESFAKSLNNDITLDLTSSFDSTMTGSGTLDDNTVGAAFTGNSSTSSLTIDGGANPTFTGSAVVLTSQNYAGNGIESVNNADNLNTNIAARVFADAAFESEVYTLSGSVTVDGNTVSASATGNASLGNLLSVNGGINIAGSTASATATLDDTETQQDTSATGSLVVVTNQLMQDLSEVGVPSALVAYVNEASVTGYVQDLSSGSLSVSDNTISGSARGNSYSGDIATGENVTTLNGGVSFATMQSVSEASVSSGVVNTLIEARAGDDWQYGIENSSLLVLDNTVSSAAYGNLIDQGIALEATSLNIGTTAPANLLATTDGLLDADGSVLLSSQQTLYDAPVSAYLLGSVVQAQSWDDGGTDGSTVTVGGNLQEAVAVGGSALNALDIQATTVGSGIGVTNNQIVDINSDINATFAGTARVYVSEDVGDNGASTISLIDNTQRAVAYANTASNSLSIAATTANASFSYAEASELDLNATASNSSISAFSILNTQLASSDVNALVGPTTLGASQFEVFVGLDVQDGSAVVNDRNVAVAAAYGNQATNAGSLELNSLVMADFEGSIEGESSASGIVSVSNAQYVDSNGFGSTIFAQVRPVGDAGVLTYVSEDLFGGSSVSTSTNTLQAQSLGNAATNTLDVIATQISAFGGFPTMSDGGDVNHSIGVNNVQTNDFTRVEATLRDSAEVGGSMEVVTYVGGDINDSSAVSLNNALLANAGSNRATNGLTVTTTGLQATTAVNNTQTTRGDTIATIGFEGTGPTEGTIGGTVTNSGTAPGTMSLGGNDLTVQGASVTFTFASALNAAQAAFINSQAGFSGASNGSNTATIAVGTWNVAFFNNFTINSGAGGVLSGDEEFTATGFELPGTDGSLGTPTAGGVFIVADASITNSTLRVDNNKVKGSAIGNDATNSLVIASTSISRASNQTQTHTHDWDNDVDLGVGNWQDAAESSSSIATVISSFHIDQEFNNSITNSLISVSGNEQSATAVANLGDSELIVTATDLASSPLTIGLASAQNVYSEAEASSEVSALSIMEVYAPIQSSGSTINLNDNSNRAVGIFNDATNMLAVTGSNIGSVSLANADSNDTLMSADFALQNTQNSIGTLDTVAETVIYNQDLVDTATNGVINGTVEVMGNLTLAESSANRSVNTAMVNGTANQGASVGLGNVQNSSSIVTASATTTATLNLTGTDAVDALNDRAPLNTSSATMAGNTTQSLARGNSAINALTSDAGAQYTTVSGLAGSANDSVNAAAIVRNEQNNRGSVSSSATADYTVALNSAGGAPSVLSSTVTVANNTVAAFAYGNQASNQLTLTPLNSGLATGAINSTQFNSGAITATATSVTFHIGSSAGTTNASAFRTTGNAVTATAVGNSVTSALIGR